MFKKKRQKTPDFLKKYHLIYDPFSCPQNVRQTNSSQSSSQGKAVHCESRQSKGRPLKTPLNLVSSLQELSNMLCLVYQHP